MTMNAQRKPQLGDQRYLACWCDTASLELDALANGWKRESDVGPLDYTDCAEHETYVDAADFDAAVKIARAHHAADFFGCPRVYLQEYGPADVPVNAREWEDVKFWDVPAEGDPEEQSV